MLIRNRITHTNSENETLDFADLGIFLEENTLRDYEYTVDSENEYITDIYKGIVTRTVPFVFICSPERAAEIRNTFYEHFDKDILNFQKGYFEINGYRLYCYATKSTKDDYLDALNMLRITLEITTDEPNWVKETTYSFLKDTSSTVKGESKTYDYTYSYTYGTAVGESDFTLGEALTASNFKLIIYGTVVNPSVTIGGHLYNVNVQLDSSERLEIDSREKTVEIVHNNGSRTNVFSKRNYESSVFEKMNTGRSVVSWSGTFGFDVIVYQERSEPIWKQLT